MSHIADSAARKRTSIQLLLLFLLVTPCLAQKATQHSTTSLAKPLDWGAYKVRLFKDDRTVIFTLTTSWIPGENHKGMMRYKMSVRADESEHPIVGVLPGDEARAQESLLVRVSTCYIELDLYDADQFVLRKIPVPLTRGVDTQARLTSLLANSSV
jgi:hypothetical protein